MTGLLSIIFSAVTSVVIAHFLKVTESQYLNTIRVLTVNYLVASTLAFSYTYNIGVQEIDVEILFQPLLLSVGVGIIFIANFFIYSKSVYHNGVGISIAAMRISLIIPVILSVIWYLESLTYTQWAGVLLVFVILLLLIPQKNKVIYRSFKAGWLLILLFIGTGIGDASMKIYEVEYSGIIGKEFFMGIVFLVSFFAGLCVTAYKKSWKFSRKEVLLGISIGIPNLLTSLFLIEALQLMNGAIVYSSVNVLTVLGGTLLGVICWKDKFSTVQWIGIFLTLISIFLLIL
jgi:drug/metabolite transporter (DMT)-like permease